MKPPVSLSVIFSTGGQDNGVYYFFVLILALVYMLYSPSDRRVKAFINNTHKTDEKASLFGGFKALYTRISLLNRTNALEKFGVSKFNIFVFFIVISSILALLFVYF